MKKENIGLIALMGLMSLVGLVGCQNDDVEPVVEEPKQYNMELLPYSNSFLDVDWWGTRASNGYVGRRRAEYIDHLPANYVSYEVLYPTTTPNNNTIGVFMTPERTSSVGNFIYQGVENNVNVWRSTITVTKDQQYYIYGFMPSSHSDAVQISPLGPDLEGPDKGYATGAVLTIRNYNALTAADVCVVTGVRWATAEEKINGPDSDVKLGSFGYLGMETGNNRIFVLLKHIYAGLNFEAHVDAGYRALRKIVLTSAELVANNITEKVNLSITLKANDTGDDPVYSVVYDPVGTETTSSSITLFPYDSGPTEWEIPVTSPASFLGCYVPNSCSDFVLHTTYDVYDTNDNLVRKDCEAYNKINSNLIPSMSSMKAGDVVNLDMLIKPSFLYVLSEPDLDNPTITISVP